MSRLIRTRSPYFIKVTPEEGKTLSAATADVYLWQGKLTDKPSKSTYRLNKQTIGDQDFVVFDVSEMARDELNTVFTGTKRETQPVYINVEVSKINKDRTVDKESFLVLGLDGWGYHEDGVQASENLFKDADEWDGVDAADEVSAVLTSNLDDSADADVDRTVQFGDGVGITLTCTINPSDATITWQKDGTDISGQTGTTYSISSASTSDEGEYTCTADDGTTEDVSNTLTLELNDDFLVINPSQVNLKHTAGASNTNNVNVSLIYDSSSTTLAAGDFDDDDINGFEFAIGTTTTANSKKTTTVNIWSPKENASVSSDKTGKLYVTYKDVKYTINIRQAKTDGISAVTVLNPTIPYSGVDSSNQIKVTVQGTLGTKYELRMDSILPDGWTSATSALDSVYGTVGTTTHYIDNIDENDTANTRRFRLFAVNRDNSADVTDSNPIVTQLAQDANVVIITNSLDNFDVAGETMTIKVWNSAPATLRMQPTGANHFRFVTEDDAEVFSYDIRDLHTADDPFEIKVKAPQNTNAALSQRISARLLGSNTELDWLVIRQDGPSAQMYFQKNGAGPNDTTEITTLPVPGCGEGYGCAQVRSSVPWVIEDYLLGTVQVTVPSGKAGITQDVCFSVTDKNDGDSVDDYNVVLKDKGTKTLVNKTLVLKHQTCGANDVSGVPTNVSFDEYDIFQHVNQQFTLSLTATNATDYTIELVNNEDFGIPDGQAVKNNTSGDFNWTLGYEGMAKFTAYASNAKGDSADNANITIHVTQQQTNDTDTDDAMSGLPTSTITFPCEGGSKFITGITPKSFNATLQQGAGKFCFGSTQYCNKNETVTSGNFTVYATPHYPTNGQDAENTIVLTATGYLDGLIYLKQEACSPVNPTDSLGEVIEEPGIPTPDAFDNTNNGGGGGGLGYVKPGGGTVEKPGAAELF